MPTRSQIRSTSARTWVEKMIVARSRSSAMSASRSRRPSGSSELTGSSRIEEAGLGDERLRDPQPLAHPARVAADPAVGGLGEADLLEGRGGAVAASRCGEPLQPAGEVDQLAAGHPAVVARILVEHADRGRGAEVARIDAACRRSRPAGRRPASPVMSRSVVVLPAPFGPSRPKTDPRGTSRSSRSRARTPAPRRTASSARDSGPPRPARSPVLAPHGEVQDRAEQRR